MVSYYREVADSLITEVGLNQYLILLSVYQTCKYKGVSFLKFLLSRETDIDRFCENGNKMRPVPDIELYPEGFLSPRLSRRRIEIQDLKGSKDPVGKKPHRVMSSSPSE